MKSTTRLGRVLWVTAILGIALPVSAQSVPSANAGAKGAKAAAAGAGAANKDEAKEGKIVGTVIARGKGGFLGLSLEGGAFKLGFYDAKKKPVAIDVASGTARWQPLQKKMREFASFEPSGDGKALVSAKIVQPPHLFTVTLTLLDAAGSVVESYSVDFRG